MSGVLSGSCFLIHSSSTCSPPVELLKQRPSLRHTLRAQPCARAALEVYMSARVRSRRRTPDRCLAFDDLWSVFAEGHSKGEDSSLLAMSPWLLSLNYPYRQPQTGASAWSVAFC